MEVIGANIPVKSTSTGAITEINGEYTNSTEKDDSQSLDEVVVVAYGTQTKATLTSALSSIDTIKDTPFIESSRQVSAFQSILKELSSFYSAFI